MWRRGLLDCKEETTEFRSKSKSSYSSVATTPNSVARKYSYFILLMDLVGQVFRQDTAEITCLYSRRCGAWAGKSVDGTKGPTSKMASSFTCLLLNELARRLLSAGSVSQDTYRWPLQCSNLKIVGLLTWHLSVLMCCSVNKVEAAYYFMISPLKSYIVTFLLSSIGWLNEKLTQNQGGEGGGHPSSQGRNVQELGAIFKASIVFKKMKLRQFWNCRNSKLKTKVLKGRPHWMIVVYCVIKQSPKIWRTW